MNILIVGAGIVGFNLAQELSHEGHDISIIDSDSEKIKVISEKLDVLAIRGNGCLPSTLIQGRILDAQMVIAVTDKDEINLMVCFLAHKFEVKETFARLRDMELTGESQVFKPKELHVDHAINPAEIIMSTPFSRSSRHRARSMSPNLPTDRSYSAGSTYRRMRHSPGKPLRKFAR